MMSVVVHKDHAVIHTATIDVKIMRLGKRQVTQSVFRQLEEECVFDVGLELRGKLWGRVNYLWNGCPAYTNYHIVWQKENELRRMPLCLIKSLEHVCYWNHRDNTYQLKRDKYCEPKPDSFGQAVLYSIPDYHGPSYSQMCEEDDEGYPRPFVDYLEKFEALDQLFIAT